MELIALVKDSSGWTMHRFCYSSHSYNGVIIISVGYLGRILLRIFGQQCLEGGIDPLFMVLKAEILLDWLNLFGILFKIHMRW